MTNTMTSAITSAMGTATRGICLNMIVKNETRVLDRLFRSIKDYIDYYVIVDTGSTDGTQDFIRKWMDEAGIEGEVHERPWVNFGHNRQEALELALATERAAWLLFIDADEELGVADPAFRSKLETGVTYNIEKHHNNTRYAVPHILDVTVNRWQWRGVVHNHLVHLEGPRRTELRKDVWIVYHPGEGAKSHGVTSEEKYLRDAKMLRNELRKNPDDTRSQFYLGQSYKDAKHYSEALEAYTRRAAMEGFDEEKFIAQLEVGRMSIHLAKSEAIVVREFLKAFEIRPRRAEPLHDLARYFRNNKRHASAYVFARTGVNIPRPDDLLLIAEDIYAWRLLDELAIAAFWIGNYVESKTAGDEIIRRVNKGMRISAKDLKRIQQNLAYANVKIANPA